MPFSPKARQYAEDILQARRQTAAVRAAEHKRALSERYPKLNEFDQEISSLGISMAKAAVAGSVDISAIDAAIGEIKKKRLRYMKRNGIDADLSFYHCGICEDTGYAGDALCDCAIKLMIEYTSNTIAKSSPLKLSSFSDFDLSLYSANLDPDHKNTSPRKNMERVYESCIKFTRDFPKYDNLLFMGDAGLGKTHLALAIANEIIGRGYNVVYCNSSNIFRAIETEYFQDQRSNETLAMMKQCDLLILDDLGSEFVNSFIVSALYDIVNTRLIGKLPTVYTTNIISRKMLENRYGEKVSSRLLGACVTLSFYGDDIRFTEIKASGSSSKGMR